MQFALSESATVTGAVPDGIERVMPRSLAAGFIVGAGVGLLGGLIGLGGAEFRLPVLIGVFGFIALQAVIVNKALSLVVVTVALVARLFSVPLDDVLAEWEVIVNLLAGSLLGAWLGATWATRMASRDPLPRPRRAARADCGGARRPPASRSSTCQPERRWPPDSPRVWESGSSPRSWASLAASC